MGLIVGGRRRRPPQPPSKLPAKGRSLRDGRRCSRIPRVLRFQTHIGPPSTLRPVQVTVRLFAGLRERAGFGERALELDDGARVADVWPALALGDGASRPSVCAQPRVRRARKRARRRRRGRADPARFRRRLPAVLGAARPDRSGRRGRRRPGRGDRDLPRHRPRPLARPDRALPRVRGLRRHGRAGHGTRSPRSYASATTSAASRSTTAPAASRSASRASRSPSPPRTARTRSPPAGRDRHAQGARAALEEGGLRGRRGVDRPRVLSSASRVSRVGSAGSGRAAALPAQSPWPRPSMPAQSTPKRWDRVESYASWDAGLTRSYGQVLALRSWCAAPWARHCLRGRNGCACSRLHGPGPVRLHQPSAAREWHEP